jgi:transposase-like protein
VQADQVQHQTRVTPDLLAQLITAYQAGATCYELATKYQINRNTITKHLRQAGLRLRLDGLSPDQIQQAISLYQVGQSLARIGQQLGVTANTVQARLIDAGIPMRDTHGRPR